MAGMAQDVPVTVPAIQAVTAATGVAEPMAPASPEPKRPRQRDTSAATAMVRDITLPELVGEFAALHHRFGIDETYVTHAVDAVDHNAVLLGEVLTRLAAAEAKLGIAETVVTQHKSEVMANATALDLQLRTELNAVTTRLGDDPDGPHQGAGVLRDPQGHRYGRSSSGSDSQRDSPGPSNADGFSTGLTELGSHGGSSHHA